MLFDNFFLTDQGVSLINSLLSGETMVWTRCEGSSEIATEQTTSFASKILSGHVVSTSAADGNAVNISCSLDNTDAGLVAGLCNSIGIFGKNGESGTEILVAVATVGSKTPAQIPAYDGTAETKAIVLLNAAIELSDGVVSSVSISMPNVYALASDLQHVSDNVDELAVEVQNSVKLTGNQSIGGRKLFRDFTIFNYGAEIYDLRANNIRSDDTASPIVIGDDDSYLSGETLEVKAPAHFKLGVGFDGAISFGRNISIGGQTHYVVIDYEFGTSDFTFAFWGYTPKFQLSINRSDRVITYGDSNNPKTNIVAAPSTQATPGVGSFGMLRVTLNDQNAPSHVGDIISASNISNWSFCSIQSEGTTLTYVDDSTQTVTGSWRILMGATANGKSSVVFAVRVS